MIKAVVVWAGLVLAALDATAAGPETLAVRIVRSPEAARLVFEWTQPVEYRLARDGDSLTITFARGARFDADKLARQLPPQITRLRADAADGGLRVTIGTAPGAFVHDSRNGAKVILDVASAPPGQDARKATRADTAPIRLMPPAEAGLRREERTALLTAPAAGTPQKAAPSERPIPLSPRVVGPSAAPTVEPAASTAASTAALPLIGVDAWRAGERIVLRFNWRSEVAAAVFVRGGAVWIAFDEPARIDAGGIQAVGRSALGAVRQLPVDGATVIHAPVEGPWGGEVKREGTAWIVELTPDMKAAADTIDVRVKPGQKGLEAVMTPGPAGRPLRLIDPDGNDAINVVPLRVASGAIMQRSFIDFEILSSLQGVAIRPNVDKVSLRIASNEITVSREGGLRLTQPGAVAAHRAAPNNVRPRLLNFAAWGVADEPYNAQRVKMQLAVVNAIGGDKAAARLALARFFLAHGRAAEALGVIGEIVRLKPEIETTAELLALRGAAHLIQGEYADALADLSNPRLKETPELDPWRAMLAAARGAWQDAYARFDESDGLFAQYPAWLAGRFGLVATEAALVASDVDTARIRLAAPAIAALTGADRHYADVLRGHLLKNSGDIEGAKKIWQKVARGGDRLSRAKARFAETDALYVQGAIDIHGAIERLEKLAFGWRGDAFEFDLLNRLATLKTIAQDYRGALAALRSAVTYFESVHGAQASAADMNDQFRGLFLGSNADAMSPVVALGLFEEFRELIPAGKDGDEMIRKLAERLVRVDLLDEAASLLERQMSIRLAGVQKAEVGARLATIRLAANRPEEVVGALAGSAEPNLPDDLVRQRTLLRARAEGRLGRTDVALNLLAADPSREADGVRLEIYWRQSMWRDVAAVFARWMTDTDPARLDDQKARLVLNWAVALALSGDQPGVDALRRRFAARFAAGTYGQLFKAIVGEDGAPPPDYRALAKQVADLDTLNGFMAGYRSTSGKPVLSAVQ